jgi:hypothetical protein
MIRRLFSFPNPVNEVSARLVAGGVVLMAVVTIAFDLPWMTAVIAYGFVARVLTPRLPFAAKPVAGPPKRFAQGVGAVVSVTAAVLALGFGQHVAAYAVLGLLVVAATLESVFAYCLGCKIFGMLMRAGVVPERICARCVDVPRSTSAADPPVLRADGAVSIRRR